MKKLIAAILAITMIFTVAGCSSDPTSSSADNTEKVGDAETTTENITTTTCNHEWKDATCNDPKTCSICGTVEGTKLEHSWKEANCSDPKTCKLCGATEGSSLGHKWKTATCETAKKCSTCGKTEGSANGHSYVNGICSVCNKENPKLAGIREALVDCERYVTYLDIDAQILETQIELYRTTGESKYLVEIADSVSDIHSSFMRIREYTEPYDELFIMYSEAEDEIPIFSSSSLAKVSTYARKASRMKEYYEPLCERYGV